MKSLIYSLLLGCLCISSSRADFRAYEAEVDESVWDYSGNPVRCELKHKIPLFGDLYICYLLSKDMFFGLAISFTWTVLHAIICIYRILHGFG